MENLIELRKGDNDGENKWGGQTLQTAPSYTVKSLQEDLKKAGTFSGSENGVFDTKTEKSLKLFQWACVNMENCLKKKSNVKRIRTFLIFVNGILDKPTKSELENWTKQNLKVTGDLIRIPFSELSNIEAGPGFKKLSSAKTNKDDIVISKAAKSLLTDLNSKARKEKVTAKINQAFREHGVKVTGSVVPPANKSQHLIGHALDCNILDGGSWNNSTNFKNNKETQSAKDIIKHLKKSGHRWGGDFTTSDTPHFDSKLEASTFSYDAKFFLNQKMISENHDIPKEKP